MSYLSPPEKKFFLTTLTPGFNTGRLPSRSAVELVRTTRLKKVDLF